MLFRSHSLVSARSSASYRWRSSNGRTIAPSLGWERSRESQVTSAPVGGGIIDEDIPLSISGTRPIHATVPLRCVGKVHAYMAERHVLTSMEDCDRLLDDFLCFNGRQVLDGQRTRRE